MNVFVLSVGERIVGVFGSNVSCMQEIKRYLDALIEDAKEYGNYKDIIRAEKQRVNAEKFFNNYLWNMNIGSGIFFSPFTIECCQYKD